MVQKLTKGWDEPRVRKVRERWLVRLEGEPLLPSTNCCRGDVCSGDAIRKQGRLKAKRGEEKR